MNLVSGLTRNKLLRNSTEPSILARGKIYIMVSLLCKALQEPPEKIVPVLNKHTPTRTTNLRFFTLGELDQH